MVVFRSSYVGDPQGDVIFLINFSSALYYGFVFLPVFREKDKYLGSWFHFDLVLKFGTVKQSVNSTDEFSDFNGLKCVNL